MTVFFVIIFGIFIIALLCLPRHPGVKIQPHSIIPTINNQELIATVTELDRGTWSERNLVLGLLKMGFKPGAIFHDLYIRKSNGQYAQIDLVLATRIGLIVFEVKDYGGWIFGNRNQTQWTQVLAHGREKYRFYNPVLQNAKHITELRKLSKQFAKLPIFSVIVFYGSCRLRDISFIPRNTYITNVYNVPDVIDTILSNAPLADYTDKIEVIRLLSRAVHAGDAPEFRQQHAATVRDILGKDRIFD